jgi:division protein CdvB (Snf7/Vps24/ESCRT-III family)
MEDRKVLIDKLAAQLKQWDAEIQKLEAKVNKVDANVRANYRQKLDDLRTKKQEANSKLQEIKDSGEEAWGELKVGFEKSWKSINDAINNAISKFG